ncbi:MAG: O-methyltransferase [Candidatus Paracaedibacteraceae bacterium]|nr:O-methyltransferase [Candidatus Paracaedibacteraceae bacterium]
MKNINDQGSSNISKQSTEEPSFFQKKRKIVAPYNTELEYVRAYLAKCVTLSPVQKKIQAQNNIMPEGRMQIRPELAHFLGFILRLIKPQSILEVGSYTGFSALTFAESTDPSCKITAIDRNLEWTKLAEQFWKEAKISDRIHLIYGDAFTVLTDIIAQKKSFYDFIFIDADKKNYESYVNCALKLLAPSGLIIVDNVLWRGEVAKTDSVDPIAKMIHAFNERMFERTDIRLSIVPLDDGIMMIQKK